MYRKIEDFVNDWEYEAGETLRLFKQLTDEALNHSFHQDHRTLGRLAWHITYTLAEMMHTAGLPIELIASEPETFKAENLVSLYEKEADAVKRVVQRHWVEEDLPESIPMYGDDWAKGAVLSVLIRHQAHHRGQMTVLMRQAGLKVPGIYGPSREEWEAMGMPAMA